MNCGRCSDVREISGYVPVPHKSQLPELRTKTAVREFAGTIGIHPGIVVGRLQHDGLIEPSWMNDLRESFRLVAAK